MRTDDRRDDERADGPEEIFRALRDRETPELDSEAAWRRLRAALPEREPVAGWMTGWTTGWRAAAASAAALAVVSLVTWQALDGPSPVASDDGTVAAASDLVLLAGALPEAVAPPEDAAADAAVPEAASMRLDVRLLREGMQDDPALGAGGADASADIGDTLAAVLPDRQYGVLGWWQGELSAGAMETDLATGYRLTFEVDPADPRTLRRVRLSGDRGPVVADEIRLEPGQVYLFGVRGADGSAADVLLAIRLRSAAAED